MTQYSSHTILHYIWVWGYFWAIYLLLVQAMTLFSCSPTPISYKGAKFRAYLAQFSRSDAGQTDRRQTDRRDDRFTRLLHFSMRA